MIRKFLRHEWSGLPVALGLYVAVLVALRLAVSGGLELDESEQMVLAQSLRWGYGPQPPLYTWLQYGMFRFLGPGLLSLVLLKYGLVYLFLIAYLILARRVLGDERAAVTAVLALFLSPQFGWEFMRTLTNTVLVTALSAWFLVLLPVPGRSPGTGRYIILGLLCGAGAISKYNFLLAAAGILAAAFHSGAYRPLLLSPRMAAFAAASTAVVLGHAVWAVANLDNVLSFTGKMRMAHGPTALSLISGPANLLMAAVGLHWPFLLLGVPLLMARRTGVGAMESPRGDAGAASLLERAAAWVMGLAAVFVVITRTTRFNDRWLAPALFFAPILILNRLRPRVTAAGGRAFAVLALASMAATAALLPGRVVTAALTGKATRYNLPYGEMAELIRQEGFDGGNIVAATHREGGNLLLRFPGSTANVPGRPEVAPLPEKPFLLAWEAGNDAAPPEDLLGLAARLAGRPVSTIRPRYLQAPLRFTGSGNFRLGIILVPP